jgi:uncharacterized protein (DUF1778 family)
MNEPRRSESRRRKKLIALRLLPAEHAALDAAARARGVTLSEFIRSSALLAAQEKRS